jgi:hypothetical protein
LLGVGLNGRIGNSLFSVFMFRIFIRAHQTSFGKSKAPSTCARDNVRDPHSESVSGRNLAKILDTQDEKARVSRKLLLPLHHPSSCSLRTVNPMKLFCNEVICGMIYGVQRGGWRSRSLRKPRGYGRSSAASVVDRSWTGVRWMLIDGMVEDDVREGSKLGTEAR